MPGIESDKDYRYAFETNLKAYIKRNRPPSMDRSRIEAEIEVFLGFAATAFMHQHGVPFDMTTMDRIATAAYNAMVDRAIKIKGPNPGG